MSHLSIQNAGYQTDGKTHLQSTNLELDCSGVIGILGPNGAGKSLFLSLAHGILKSSSGKVFWDGKPAQSTRKTRGFLFQSTVVLRRSVQANVSFALQATFPNLSKSERDERVHIALKQTRLANKATDPAAALSGGETRRMALARALVCEPRVILMDEPFNGLDPTSTFAFEDIIHSIKSAGTGLMIVNHNLPQAKRLADTVLFFDKGQLKEPQKAEDFFDGPQSEAAIAYLEGKLP